MIHSAIPTLAHARLDRDAIERQVESLISLLDLIDGNADLEEDDPAEEDDPCGQYDEDCYSAGRIMSDGPGCTLSDPGGC